MQFHRVVERTDRQVNTMNQSQVRVRIGNYSKYISDPSWIRDYNSSDVQHD